jgi:hypothetical protein
MRKKMLSILLAVLLASFASQAIALTSDDENTQEDDTELWQIDQLDQQRPQRPPGPDQHHPRGEGRPGPGCRPSQDQQFGCMPGRQGQRMTPPQQRGFQQATSTEYLEQLQIFLAEHEPSLAELLAELQENEPERFERSIGTIVRHYGPIMEQMEHDPEMAEINLRKTRLTLEVEQALRAVKNAKDDPQASEQATQLLRDKVAQLYELILQQQNMELDQATERYQSMQQWLTLLEERQSSDEETEESPMPMMQGMRHRRAVPEMMPGRYGPGENWGQRRCQEMQRRLDQRRKQLDTWQDNADSIIESRIQQLLTGGEPFPW